jgi:hypothetical protein
MIGVIVRTFPAWNEVILLTIQPMTRHLAAGREGFKLEFHVSRVLILGILYTTYNAFSSVSLLDRCPHPSNVD